MLTLSLSDLSSSSYLSVSSLRMQTINWANYELVSIYSTPFVTKASHGFFHATISTYHGLQVPVFFRCFNKCFIKWSTGCCSIVPAIMHVSVIEYFKKLKLSHIYILCTLHTCLNARVTEEPSIHVWWKKNVKQVNVCRFFCINSIANDHALSIMDKENSFCWFTTKPDSMNYSNHHTQHYLLPFCTTDTWFCGTNIISSYSFIPYVMLSHRVDKFRGEKPALKTRASEHWVQ